MAYVGPFIVILLLILRMKTPRFFARNFLGKFSLVWYYYKLAPQLKFHIHLLINIRSLVGTINSMVPTKDLIFINK